MHPRRLIPASLAAIVLAGCGIANPYSTPHPSTTTAASVPRGTPTAASTTDDPSDPQTGTQPPGQLTTAPTSNTEPASPAAGTAQAALGTYARIDTNWTAQSLRAVQEQLATISVGQARATALQAAASYGKDSVLQHSQVRNAGTVVAIAPSRTRPGEWVVVTNEDTTGQGDYADLPPGLHVTYARVLHTTAGYRVSTWSPQN